MKNKILMLALGLLGGAVSLTAQSPSLGLNFASTDPNAGESSLLPGEAAGVIPHANWNNFVGATGSAASGLVYDLGGVATASTASVTWSSPNTWRAGGNNAFPAGPDRKLVNGYLDTGNTAANGISLTVNGIDPVFTTGGYDVYVYFVSDNTGNRGGGYTLNDGSGPVVKYGSTMAAPASFIEDPGTDANLSADGTYLRFVGFSGSSFTLTTDTTLTTPNGTRAPINAIQIVPSTQFGPDITRQPRSTELYAGRTARFTAATDGFPRITSVKWQKDGVDLTDDARISGAGTGTLTITGVTTADEGDYTFVATSPRGEMESDPAGLEIVTADGSDYVTEVLTAAPAAYWRLNEAADVMTAFDPVGGLTGLYLDGVTWGSEFPGPAAPDFPGFLSGNTAADYGSISVESKVAVPTPALNSNTATLVAWIKPGAPQANYAGVFMTRDGTSSGLGYTTDNQLGYTWNNNTTWSWNSGLRPPDGVWSMVAVVITPARATLFLGANGSLSAAINPIAHTAEAWGGTAWIGNDSGGAARVFFGSIDEVTVFNRALTFAEVAGLYEAATGIPQELPPTVSPQPVSATRYEGGTVMFSSGAAGESVTVRWQKDGSDLTDNEQISGATTTTLTIQNVTSANAGDYRMIATNPVGSTESDLVTLTVLPVPHAYVEDVLELDPLSYYRLNDTAVSTAGVPLALDYWGGHDGTYGAAAQGAAAGIEGPRPSQGYGTFETDNAALRSMANADASWATVAGPGISTATITLLAWINPETRVNSSGIVFARAGGAATGLNLTGTGNLGYHWLDAAATYNFASGLVPPVNQWSLVAVVVEPTQATLHMVNSDGAQSAVNTTTHAVRAFTDNIRIGGDPNNVNRTFNGRIDEVAIFDQALTGQQIQSLYNTAIGVVAPSIAVGPAPAEEYPGSAAQFTVSAAGTAPLTYQWQKGVGGNFTDIGDGGNVSGATTSTLTIQVQGPEDAAQYRVTVSNAQGSDTSEPAALTVLTPPAHPGEGTFGGAVLDSGALSYWRFNETADPSTGVLEAYDSAGGRHATYGVATLNGFHAVEGPRPATGFNLFEASNSAIASTASTANSWVTAPGLGITTDTLTILAWINPATLVNNAGIVFARAGQPATGMNLSGAGMLGYHWLDTAASYSWASGITPPVGEWSLAALVVEPTQATVHLINAAGTQTAVNSVTHAARAFTDAIRIGGDPNSVDRTFSGSIDEVAIFDAALSLEEIQGIYAGEAVEQAPELTITREGNQVTISWEGPGTLQSASELPASEADWTDVTTTGNSHTATATAPEQYYRVVR